MSFLAPVVCGWCSFVVIIGSAGPVAAQDSTAEIARRDLIGRAEAARDTGDHVTAARLANDALRIRRSPSLRLLLAQEQRALGHMIDALDQATACEREARSDVTVRNRERVAEVCRVLANEIEPTIGRLLVRVSPFDVAGLRVQVGDAEFPRALLGVPSPVMPGRLTVRVEAVGHRSVNRVVEVSSGRVSEILVTLETEANSIREPLPMARRTDVGRVASVVTAPRALDHEPTTPSQYGSTRDQQAGEGAGAGPWVTVGTGVAGVGLGVALRLMAGSAQADRDRFCTSAGCENIALEHDATYRSLLIGSAIGFVAGSAAIVGGLLWQLLSPSGAPTSASAGIVPLRGGWIIELGGRL